MVSVIVLVVVVMSVEFFSVMLSVIKHIAVMLSVVFFYYYAECHHVGCGFC
jgi:hypothetical protein